MITWKYTLTVCGVTRNGDAFEDVGRSYWFVTRSRMRPLPALMAASGPYTIGRTHAVPDDAAGVVVVVLPPVDAALVATSTPATSAAVAATAATPSQSRFFMPRPPFATRCMGSIRTDSNDGSPPARR